MPTIYILGLIGNFHKNWKLAICLKSFWTVNISRCVRKFYIVCEIFIKFENCQGRVWDGFNMTSINETWRNQYWWRKLWTRDNEEPNQSCHLCSDFFAVKIWQWSSIARRICMCKTSKFNISPEIAITPLRDHLYCLKSHFLGNIHKVVRNKSFFEICNPSRKPNQNLTLSKDLLALFVSINLSKLTFHMCLHTGFCLWKVFRFKFVCLSPVDCE